MQNEIRQNPDREVDYKSAMNMSYSERRISFMNRYFIFQKVRNVNTEKMGKILDLKKAAAEIEDEADVPDVSSKNPPKKGRKLKVPKIVLEKYEPVESDSIEVEEKEPEPAAKAEEPKPKTYIFKVKKPKPDTESGANKTRKNVDA